jgi:hypothetical protein
MNPIDPDEQTFNLRLREILRSPTVSAKMYPFAICNIIHEFYMFGRSLTSLINTTLSEDECIEKLIQCMMHTHG